MAENRFEDFDAHFPKDISSDLINFVHEECLIGSRYLFVQRLGSTTIQRGFCTHCKQDRIIKSTKALKHNESWRCDSCKSMVIVKSSGLGRGKLVGRGYVVWYEKSLVDPKAMVCTGYKIIRDYREGVDIETKFTPVMRCVFAAGSAVMALRSHYRSGFFSNRCTYFLDGWEFAKKPRTQVGKHYFTRLSYKSIENIRAAASGTPFQYSTWEQYTTYRNPDFVSDMVEFFDLAASYPCVEYLTKAGFRKVVEAKLHDEPTYGAIYWQGKTLQKVLRLTKLELRELRDSGLSFTPKQLHFFQKSKKAGKRLALADAFVLADIDDDYYQKYYIAEFLKRTTEEEMTKYILKQVRNNHYSNATSAAIAWLDYQRECVQLGMDLKQERYLFPNNLKEAHTKTFERIRQKKDKRLNGKIERRLTEELNAYRFEHMDLIFRPAASSGELFVEGKTLEHCVGGYSGRYAEGKTNIFLIRQAAELDKPFYTLEINDDRIVQCHGFKHCAMTPEVQEAVNAFFAFYKKKAKQMKNRQGATAV